MHTHTQSRKGIILNDVFFQHEIFYNLFIYYLWVHCNCLQTHQKGATDLITDGCEPPYGCWDLGSGPPEEQSVLLTTESSHQPLSMRFLVLYFWTSLLGYLLVYKDLSVQKPGSTERCYIFCIFLLWVDWEDHCGAVHFSSVMQDVRSHSHWGFSEHLAELSRLLQVGTGPQWWWQMPVDSRMLTPGLRI